MPQLIIDITEEQKNKILKHFNRPINVDYEEAFPPALDYTISIFLGAPEFTVSINDDNLNIGKVRTNFNEVLKHEK